MSDRETKNIKTQVRVLTNEEMAELGNSLPNDETDANLEATEELKEIIASIKEEEITKITPPEDHQEKYNVDITEANEKMKSIGKIKGLKADVVTVDEFKDIETKLDEESQRILHKRTKKDYHNIWKAFLENEEKNFEKIMGYGKKIIKKIGIKKFIDTMDWRGPSDVSKYKTDKFHVVICPNCRQEFGVYEDNIGLCSRCVKDFEMDRFWATYQAAVQTVPQEAETMIKMFFVQADFRNNYRRKTMKQRIKDMANEDYKDIETFRFIMECVAVGTTNKFTREDFAKNVVDLVHEHLHKEEERERFDKFIAGLINDASDDNWHNDIMSKMYKQLKETQESQTV